MSDFFVQGFSAMKPEELRSALMQVDKTHKLGTPVAARLHLQIAGPTFEPASLLRTILSILSPCFPLSPNTVRVRKSAESSHWSFLLQNAGGQSVFITIRKATGDTTSLRLLLIGNHGIAQIDDDTPIALIVSPATDDEHASLWKDAIADGLRSGQAVSLPTI